MGHVLEKADVLGAILRHGRWPEGHFPEEDVEEKGSQGDCLGWAPLGFWSPLLPVAGRLECWKDRRRLEVWVAGLKAVHQSMSCLPAREQVTVR